jgi:ankyrin repeat protein
MSETTKEILRCFEYNESFLEPNGAKDLNSSNLLDHDLGRSCQSPLQIAVQKGHGKIVRLLLEHHADCNQRDSEGLTPLIHAIIRGHDDVVDLLLSHGAGIQYLDDQHRSALHLAVVHRRERLLKKLLNHCASDIAVIDGCTKDGKTPLHIAIEMGHEVAVEMLLEYGASVESSIQNSGDFSLEIDDMATSF